MTNADNPENTVPTSVFASCTLKDHRRALTVTTDYGTDPAGAMDNGLAHEESAFINFRRYVPDPKAGSLA
ncbi:hypothetical protein [Streptomyces triticiradicis]|uniref:hypothetical protein n=1 Tax=Streptomyces triticiradicis TaxID=2651189 RepID=UPI001788B9C6|nr:hypothetical protein [Streptomyces triticiradicis]